jgi:general secretion pathway protein D
MVRTGALSMLLLGLWTVPVPFTLAQQNVPVLPQPRTLGNVGDAAAETPLELVEFRGIPLFEAMRLLSEESGLKIVPSEQADPIPVSLFLQNVTPLTVVAAVCQANGLIYRRDPDTGIVRIFTTRENQRDLTAFREQQTEVFTLLYPNAVNVAGAIRDLFGARVLLSYGVDDRLTFNELQQRFTRFDLINSRSLGIGFPQQTSGISGVAGGVSGVTAGGAGTTRGGTAGVGGGGGLSGGVPLSTNITQAEQQQQRLLGQEAQPERRLEGLTPEEIQELESAFVEGKPPDRTVLLDLLRRRPTTIYVTVVRAHNQLIVRTSDPTTMTQIRDLICRLDVPTPVVLLEVKVLSINLGDNFNSMFDFQFTDGALLTGGFSPAAATGTAFNSGNILPPTSAALPGPLKIFDTIAPATAIGAQGSPPPPNFLFQVVSAGFRARLQLLEDKNRVTEVASPLLMTANNEVSQIFTGEQVPITVGFTPAQTLATSVGVATTVVGTPITTLQNIGTTLLITPNINADRTVTLRILQEKSSVLAGAGTIPVPNPTTGGVTQVAVDIVDRQSFSGTIVAQDGLAVAIGGLIDETVSDQRAEVPVLGKIPVLGFFFRQQSSTRTRTELVLIIRPFVLTTPAESTTASRPLVESLSIHPNVVNGDLSTLGAYTPPEVLRPNPPVTFWQNVFRVHTALPRDF